MTQPRDPVYLRLTACDHEQNCFVHLVSWRFETLKDAKNAAGRIEKLTPTEATPDAKTCEYHFLVDFVRSDRFEWFAETAPLCLQAAMRLAPDEVFNWLSRRPSPEGVSDIFEPVKSFPLEAIQ